jgi:uncharacterized protein
VLLRPGFRRYGSEANVIAFVNALRVFSESHADPEPVPAVSRDPNDDYLIALAQSAQADYLVSGDADLSSLEMEPPTISPKDFLDALGD